MNQALIPASLESIRAPIAADMGRVDEVIRRRLDSEVVLIRTIAHYIVESGGKRLRPALVLLAANAFGATGEARHVLAAVIVVVRDRNWCACTPTQEEQKTDSCEYTNGREHPARSREPNPG